jgi:hypothetical protein
MSQQGHRPLMQRLELDSRWRLLFLFINRGLVCFSFGDGEAI